MLPGGERIPLDRALSIGRARTNDIRLEDPSISRLHAEITLRPEGPVLADAGSSYGTFADGRRLREPVTLVPGLRLELGDCQLEVAERLDRAAAGMTISVPAGISLIIEQPAALHGSAAKAARSETPATRRARHEAAVRRARLDGAGARRPRLHSGWSLKRLDASEGERRFVLKDYRSGGIVRLAEPEAEIARQLDGTRDLVDLIAEASVRIGPDGPARLARLLAELADRGFLAGIAGSAGAATPRPGWLARAVTPKERSLPWIPSAIAAVYRGGGWVLFTRAGRALVAGLAVAGLAAFVAVVAGRYGTPFVVARRVGLGAAVFVVGRLLLVLCHEFAHGLVAESFGRPVAKAGLKLALIFPYVYVDTTDAWFESRRRRMAISLAGPLSDLTVGGAFALGCLLAPAGSARDVLFQVAFAGYVGALFNLNPLLERDGYHVLVDLLREPGLRRRAARRFAAGPSGRRGDRLFWYGLATILWSAVMVAFAVVMSLRYYHRLRALAPPAAVWTLLAALYIVLALPVAIQLMRPLFSRAAAPAAEPAA